MIKFTKIFILGFILVGLSSCVQEEKITSPLCSSSHNTILFNNDSAKTLNLEIACTTEQKRVGLMNRKDLPDNWGMIFVYNNEKVRHFWMKDTLIPLSVAFVDNQWNVIDIQDMKAMDESITTSKKPAQYVIETSLGWFSSHQVSIGSKIYLKP